MGSRPFEGRVALVTGAASGIGRGIAQRLARAGAAVAVNYHTRVEQAAHVVESIRAESDSKAEAFSCDVSSPEEVRAMYDAVESSLGPVSICVANAARFLQRRMVDVTEEEFDSVMATNVKGTFFCMQEAARRMHEGGRIIAISATGPVRPQATRAVYHASKAAVEHFVKVLAIEAGPRGITVNAVAPGVTRTEGMKSRNPTLEQRAAADTPLRRIGEIDDIADVVAFVASDQARWITGQVIRANGGTA